MVERLGRRVRTVRDEQGRELFDVPDAPMADPDVPAPARFLPEYDNVLLSHADRGRFVTDEERRRLATSGPGHGSVLHDGRLRGRWTRRRDPARGTVTLTVEHLPVPKRELAKVEAEARRFLRFRDPDATAREVRTRPVA